MLESNRVKLSIVPSKGRNFPALVVNLPLALRSLYYLFIFYFKRNLRRNPAPSFGRVRRCYPAHSASRALAGTPAGLSFQLIRTSRPHWRNPMAIERTFAIIKPNAVKAGNVGRSSAKSKRAGLILRGMRLARLTPELCQGVLPGARGQGLLPRAGGLHGGRPGGAALPGGRERHPALARPHGRHRPGQGRPGHPARPLRRGHRPATPPTAPTAPPRPRASWASSSAPTTWCRTRGSPCIWRPRTGPGP